MNNAAVMNGGYMGPFPPAPGYMGADPNMGINPALLSVVAAQMGGAGEQPCLAWPSLPCSAAAPATNSPCVWP
jgi:hypothetical protein